MNVAGQRPAGAPGRNPGSSGRIAGIILAAGSSTRMGRNKLLLELGRETVVQRAARTAIDAGLDPVVVVTGHAHEAVAAQLHVFALTTVVNTNHGAGQHTSVAAGIAALGGHCGPATAALGDGRGPAEDRPARDGDAAKDCAAAIVMLADMPLVTTAMVREVATRYRETRAPLVVSRYGGDVTAPPMLYDRSLFGELMDMDVRCGRQVVRRHRHKAIEVDWPAASLRDLDRPADYEAIRVELAGGAGGVPVGGLAGGSTDARPPTRSARRARPARAQPVHSGPARG